MIVKHEIIVLFTFHLSLSSLSFLYHYVSLSVEAVWWKIEKERGGGRGRRVEFNDGIQLISFISLLVKREKRRIDSSNFIRFEKLKSILDASRLAPIPIRNYEVRIIAHSLLDSRGIVSFSSICRMTCQKEIKLCRYCLDLTLSISGTISIVKLRTESVAVLLQEK